MNVLTLANFEIDPERAHRKTQEEHNLLSVLA